MRALRSRLIIDWFCGWSVLPEVQPALVWILCGLVEAGPRPKEGGKAYAWSRAHSRVTASQSSPHHVIRPHRLHQPLPPYRLPIPTSLRRKGWTGRGRPRRVRRAQQGHGMVPRRSDVGGTVSFGIANMFIYMFLLSSVREMLL